MDTAFKAKYLANSIAELIFDHALNKDDFKSVHSPIKFESSSYTYLQDCLKTTWVSTGGAYVNQFSNKLSKILKCPYVVPVSSGTAALKLALLALNVSAGDEVLVPAFTFVASANAVSYVGASPHFIDI